jgi:hypothetical protein
MHLLFISIIPQEAAFCPIFGAARKFHRPAANAWGSKLCLSRPAIFSIMTPWLAL